MASGKANQAPPSRERHLPERNIAHRSSEAFRKMTKCTGSHQRAQDLPNVREMSKRPCPPLPIAPGGFREQVGQAAGILGSRAMRGDYSGGSEGFRDRRPPACGRPIRVRSRAEQGTLCLQATGYGIGGQRSMMPPREMWDSSTCDTAALRGTCNTPMDTGQITGRSCAAKSHAEVLCVRHQHRISDIPFREPLERDSKQAGPRLTSSEKSRLTTTADRSCQSDPRHQVSIDPSPPR